MMVMSRRAMGASTLALLAGCATSSGGQSSSGPSSSQPAAIGSFGIDLAARDTSVKPGDDFFRYTNGVWLDSTQIPADRTRWGTFDILRDKADRDQRTIIEEVALAGGQPGSNQQKIADYYNSFLNQDAIDARGMAPIQPELDEIEALTTHEQVAVFAARPGVAVTFPIALYVTLDERNPDRYVVGMTHAGIGLPEREYYRRSDGEFPAIREQYIAYVEANADAGGPERRARESAADHGGGNANR